MKTYVGTFFKHNNSWFDDAGGTSYAGGAMNDELDAALATANEIGHIKHTTLARVFSGVKYNPPRTGPTVMVLFVEDSRTAQIQKAVECSREDKFSTADLSEVLAAHSEISIASAILVIRDLKS